jgi:hypothetical protein
MRISKKPVDPPKSIPSGEAKRFTYNGADGKTMTWEGEEANRLLGFESFLKETYPDLDLFQREEQTKKFIDSGAWRSDDDMRAYQVDSEVADQKASSISDMFEDSFGSSLGGSDPFEDDPDIQRMKQEAAAREINKKRRRRR